MTQHLMQNPELMQQMMGMMNPQTNPADTANPTDPASNPAAANPFPTMGAFNPAMFGNMFGGMGGGGEPAVPPDNRPPEERYEEQLRQLNDMGFYEFDRNVQALRRSGGSVQGAVEYLLTNL